MVTILRDILQGDRIHLWIITHQKCSFDLKKYPEKMQHYNPIWQGTDQQSSSK
jgi:hypothetical protein